MTTASKRTRDSGSSGDPYAIIADRIVSGARPGPVRPLHGGVSATVEELRLLLPDGSSRKVVVRRHGDNDWKELPADVTSIEFELLGRLYSAGLPVPRPLHCDVSGDVLPGPFLVIEFITGDTTVSGEDVPAVLEEMAAFLARLHRLDHAALEVKLPAREDPVQGALEFLPAAAEYSEIRGKLRRHANHRPRNPPALVHGDYWPGNILWRNRKIAAVIDWEDAALGDPLCDLAACRQELLWQFDEAAMVAFTHAYIRRNELDLRDLSLWEIFVSAAALGTMDRWGLAPAELDARRRRSRDFLVGARDDYLAGA